MSSFSFHNLEIEFHFVGFVRFSTNVNALSSFEQQMSVLLCYHISTGRSGWVSADRVMGEAFT